jgi:hypothetical protein
MFQLNAVARNEYSPAKSGEALENPKVSFILLELLLVMLFALPVPGISHSAHAFIAVPQVDAKHLNSALLSWKSDCLVIHYCRL